jgi:site-specific recombinase XerD
MVAPECAAPEVILRHDAPIGPLSSPSAVSRIVTRNLRRAAIVAPARPGTHMLRHSLATRLVNRGVPIKQIADLLGHCSIDTTAIYSKVDVTRLTAVALPWPA